MSDALGGATRDALTRALFASVGVGVAAAAVPPAFGANYLSLALPVGVTAAGFLLHARVSPARLPEAPQRVAWLGFPVLALGVILLAHALRGFPPGPALPAAAPLVLAAIATFRYVCVTKPRVRGLEGATAAALTVVILAVVSYPTTSPAERSLLAWITIGTLAWTGLLAARTLLASKPTSAAAAAAPAEPMRRHEPVVRALPDKLRLTRAEAVDAYLAGGDAEPLARALAPALVARAVSIDAARGEVLDALRRAGRDRASREGALEEALDGSRSIFTLESAPTNTGGRS